VRVAAVAGKQAQVGKTAKCSTVNIRDSSLDFLN
jgi:hypothetical protein